MPDQIVFHSQTGWEVAPKEVREFADQLIANLLYGALELWEPGRQLDAYHGVLGRMLYVKRKRQYEPWFPNSGIGFTPIVLNSLGRNRADEYRFKLGRAYDTVRTVQLNTALRIGNDIVKLLARIQGHGEEPCFVEARNAKWLASIIMRGIAHQWLFEEDGWLPVVSMLERTRDPIVITGTLDFANVDFVKGAWIGLLPKREAHKHKSKRWRACITALREQPRLELNPKTWEDYCFGSGIDALKINAHIAAQLPQRVAVETFSS